MHQGTIEECHPEDWQRSVAITLTSAWNVLSQAVPKMKAHGGGIPIGAVASSIKGLPRRAATGLTKAVAADLVKEGIRAHAISPGTVQSPGLGDRTAALTRAMGSAEAARKCFTDRQPAGRFAALCTLLASADGAFLKDPLITGEDGITN